MKTFNIKVSNEVVDYIERLAFEVEGMKRIIKELITDNTHDSSILESETFIKYNARYEEKNAAYEVAKTELVNSQIPEEIRNANALYSWNLDFSSGILSFVVSGNEFDNYTLKEVDVNEERA